MTENVSATVNRRAAIAGLGLAGLVTGSVASTGVANAETGDQKLAAVTIADLRGSITPELGVIYFVTDTGQEGPFRFDPDDTSTEDNTGIVVVSADGHRFKRIFTGPLRIAWFGAKPDYDVGGDTGTPSDDALTAALASLELFTRRQPGFRNGLPTIAFEAGDYLFTQKKFRPDWYQAVQGLRLQGEGMYQTNLYFRCPEEENGPDNYFLYNDGTAVSNQGVVNTFTMEGISFHGVTRTERFMFYGDTRGGGNAKSMFFVDCTFDSVRRSFEIGGNVNSDLVRFLHCRISVADEAAVFWNNTVNPQSQLIEFVDCNYSVQDGTVFNFQAGGVLHITGGEITTHGTGTFLNVDDPSGTKIGLGNGRYHLSDVNPETRDEGTLVRLNAPEAHVVLINPRLTSGHNIGASNWTDGTGYAMGDRAQAGTAESQGLQRAYRCIKAHTSSADTRPGTGKDWRTYWAALFEMQITGGSIEIRGGQISYSTLLRYGNDSYRSPFPRPVFTISDGCRLVNPLYDLVEFEPTEPITDSAAIPRVAAMGCLPYTGAVPAAYASGPHEPVDVTLNAWRGFDGGTVPVHRYVFTTSPEEGKGLPGAGTGNTTFRLPRGAQVIGVRLVSTDPVSEQDYTVTNHDGTVRFLPRNDNAEPYRSESWYRIRTEEERTVVVSSRAAEPADGFFVVEYV